MACEGFVENEIIVKSDKESNFTLYCPEGRRLRIFVADTSYGRTTLETWIMGDELKGDIEINPHIGGNLELYELRAWLEYFSLGFTQFEFLPHFNRWNTEFKKDVFEYTKKVNTTVLACNDGIIISDDKAEYIGNIIIIKSGSIFNI